MVDYVVTYVDGDDPEWQELFRRRMHGLEPSANSRRYRDMDTIRYAMRGVERFMPWIGRIVLIVQSESQLPRWLNRDNPRLRIVYHHEFIPEKYLPTFNSNVIEMHINRIPGLSENFLLANDDMIPVHSSELADYFRDGIPVMKKVVRSTDYQLQSAGIFKNILFNNATLASKYLGLEHRIQLKHYHLLVPYRLSFWNGVYLSLKHDIDDSLRNSPMRTSKNVNHWVIADLQQLTEGNCIDMQRLNTTGYIALHDDTVKNDIFQACRKSKVVCINDLITSNYSTIKNAIDVLEDFIPGPSSFEL